MFVTINGDDFGWSNSCTHAIINAFENNLIQTTTLISNGEYFDEAVQIVQNSGLKNNVGIHFDLTEGTPLTDEIKKDPFFCNKEGKFRIYINRYKHLTSEQKKHAYNELKAQAEKYKKTGLLFHHADSHHHIHTAPFIFPIVMTIVKEYGIKRIRIQKNIGEIPTFKKIGKYIFNLELKIRGYEYTKLFCGADDYLSDEIRCKNRTIEIMVHPDYDYKNMLIDRDSEAPYEAPYGKPLNYLVEGIKKRGDKLFK